MQRLILSSLDESKQWMAAPLKSEFSGFSMLTGRYWNHSPKEKDPYCVRVKEINMSGTNRNEIDVENLERIVAQATGSEAVGQFVKQSLEAGLQLRVGLIREQTSNAMKRHQASGRRMSAKLPYGWRRDADDDSRMLPDGYELEVIEKIRALHQDGLSLRKIAYELIGLGYKPRRVKRKLKGKTVDIDGQWHHGLIRNILNRQPDNLKGTQKSGALENETARR